MQCRPRVSEQVRGEPVDVSPPTPAAVLLRHPHSHAVLPHHHHHLLLHPRNESGFHSELNEASQVCFIFPAPAADKALETVVRT